MASGNSRRHDTSVSASQTRLQSKDKSIKQIEGYEVNGNARANPRPAYHKGPFILDLAEISAANPEVNFRVGDIVYINSKDEDRFLKYYVCDYCASQRQMWTEFSSAAENPQCHGGEEERKSLWHPRGNESGLGIRFPDWHEHDPESSSIASETYWKEDADVKRWANDEMTPPPDYSPPPPPPPSPINTDLANFNHEIISAHSMNSALITPTANKVKNNNEAQTKTHMDKSQNSNLDNGLPETQYYSLNVGNDGQPVLSREQCQKPYDVPQHAEMAENNNDATAKEYSTSDEFYYEPQKDTIISMDLFKSPNGFTLTSCIKGIEQHAEACREDIIDSCIRQRYDFILDEFTTASGHTLREYVEQSAHRRQRICGDKPRLSLLESIQDGAIEAAALGIQDWKRVDSDIEDTQRRGQRDLNALEREMFSDDARQDTVLHCESQNSKAVVPQEALQGYDARYKLYNKYNAAQYYADSMNFGSYSSTPNIRGGKGGSSATSSTKSVKLTLPRPGTFFYPTMLLTQGQIDRISIPTHRPHTREERFVTPIYEEYQTTYVEDYRDSDYASSNKRNEGLMALTPKIKVERMEEDDSSSETYSNRRERFEWARFGSIEK